MCHIKKIYIKTRVENVKINRQISVADIDQFIQAKASNEFRIVAGLINRIRAYIPESELSYLSELQLKIVFYYRTIEGYCCASNLTAYLLIVCSDVS